MSQTDRRNRHDHFEHRGDLEATLVTLATALGWDLPFGSSLQSALAIIDQRLLRLETNEITIDSFTIDAEISA